MKFIIDEQLPPALVAWLAERGHEASHVRDLDLLSSPDRDIVAQARLTGAIILTKDSDFLTPRTAHDPLRVVLIGYGNASTRQLFEWLSDDWLRVLVAVQKEVLPFRLHRLT